ncbi:hypothetical protein GCM10008986_31080 [Salinibacillus aidingensis]|uniref:YfhD-like protein n=1 Tax=Salinibacillus aidingensis TaxID=237684 RepID=A0ABN1BPG0_9BACI|nr:hypothetical protein [Virgibacillus sp. MSP4-1]
MRKEKRRRKDEPTIAPGMDTEDELKEEATREEVEEGDYTNVTTVSWDENDPS